MKEGVEFHRQDERRKFERVNVAQASQVYVTDTKGRRQGVLRQLGRGGFMLEPEKSFKKGKKHTLVIVDERENIRCTVEAVVRHVAEHYVGFEFQHLGADAAVEIGILIGKYYDTEPMRFTPNSTP